MQFNFLRILYGVSGEGFGHSSRAKKIIKHLETKGHKILILTYGQALKPLKQFNPIKIPGIHLKFSPHGDLSILQTAKSSIINYILESKNFRSVKLKINSFNPEACITDFEPITPIISFWKKLPLISIDNQHRLTHLKIKIPKEYKKSFLIAKKAAELCVSKAEAFIILSFVKLKPKAKNAYVAPPILRGEILKLKNSNKNFVLVYLTKSNPPLIKILSEINENFIIYNYKNLKFESKNLIFKKLGENFLKDLSNCKAIIATAGFTLISESLFLKKPYFAVPLKGQFEQTLNALFLKKSKLGTFSENPSKKEIENFLSKIKKYKKRVNKINFDSNEAIQILDKILKNLSTQKL